MVGHSWLSQTTTISNSQEKTQNLKAKNSRFEECPPLVWRWFFLQNNCQLWLQASSKPESFALISEKSSMILGLQFCSKWWWFKIYVKEVAFKSSAWRISSFSYPRQNINDSHHPIMGRQIRIHGWQSTQNAVH